MNKSKKEIDYKSTYYLGIIFTFSGVAISIATRNPAFLGVMAFGIILTLNAYFNRDKWIKSYDSEEFENFKKELEYQLKRKNENN